VLKAPVHGQKLSLTAMNSARFLLVIFSICSLAHAYGLSASCRSYGTEHKDISKWLQETMEEVNSMASLAKDRITQRDDDWDNSKSALFPGFSKADLMDVKGTRLKGL
jgi:hypothetical protein